MYSQKTVTIPTPLGSMMKPITMYDAPRSDLRQRQEAFFFDIIKGQDVSVTARSLATLVQERTDVPGYELNPEYRFCYRSISPRGVSSILRRLEKKGKIISTLYGRARLYSVPMGKEVK